jgi:putative transposase
MADDELFALFDPDEDVAVTHRNLPHWEQAGKTYFITFRTADSLPQAVIDLWYGQRDDWLRHHGIDPESPAWYEALAQLPAQLRRAFHQTFSDQFHRHLDDCHGACVLRQPCLARIVADSLLHFDGERYAMGDFVVMPNHVHLLVQFAAPVGMKAQCASWKHFTARQINRVLGQTGHFWQGESFDHLVRSPEQFERVRAYIAENPRRANLREGEYLHHVRGK